MPFQKLMRRFTKDVPSAEATLEEPQQELASKLDYAERVHPPSSSENLNKNGEPLANIRALILGDAPADGLWSCSACRHENALIHYHGAYPFKYLVCDACEHKLCKHCITSGIIADLKAGSSCGRDSEARVQFAQVCAHCGLSHRAKSHDNIAASFDRIQCPCGALSDDAWFRFSIGHCSDFRRDPAACYANMISLRAEKAARNLPKDLPARTRPVETESYDLKAWELPSGIRIANATTRDEHKANALLKSSEHRQASSQRQTVNFNRPRPALRTAATALVAGRAVASAGLQRRGAVRRPIGQLRSVPTPSRGPEVSEEYFSGLVKINGT